MKKALIILIGIVFVALVLKAGMTWEKFQYEDVCLDLGGGMHTGDFPVCVIEK